MSAHIDFLTSTSFRLASIDRTQREDAQILSITLSTHELRDATALGYYALSYTWGPPRAPAPSEPEIKTHPILLNGRYYQVQPNLHDALEHLYQFYPQKLVWIDALCINQEDTKERQVQVAIMDKIYSNASLVAIWLGKPFPQLQLGFEVIDRIYKVAFREVSRIIRAQQYDFTLDIGDIQDRYGLELLTNEEMEALMDVYASRWFGRVWVIQEVALAKKVGVINGDSIMAFDKFGTVAAFLHILREWCFGDQSLWQELLPLVDFTAGIQNGSERVGEETVGLVLTKLLLWTIGFKATDPRDSVFGLWGIVRHIASTQYLKMPEHLRPSYDMSVSDVFHSVATEILETSGTLILLTLVKDPEQRSSTELPSWCPDFSSPLSSHPISGPQLKSVTPVKAGGHIEGLTRSLLPGVRGGTLKLRGFPLGPVQAIGERADEIDRSSKLVGTEHFRDVLLIQALGFVRREFAKNGAESIEKHIESWCGLDTLAKRYPGAVEGTETIRTYCKGKGFLPTLEHDIPVSEEESDAFRAKVFDNGSGLLMILSGTIFNRCIALTAGGHLAHASGSTIPGDEIWVLAVCPSPLVLRRLEPETDQFSLIGEAYVHGVMNGAAIAKHTEWRHVDLV
uniref:Heterokaryon incompatibility domain-containing protein n=1 Tax=Fusarium oxysporum (strain Fo5176) TaxID=660025 RepID=A0A0D2YJN8_FUSOF